MTNSCATKDSDPAPFVWIKAALPPNSEWFATHVLFGAARPALDAKVQYLQENPSPFE